MKSRTISIGRPRIAIAGALFIAAAAMAFVAVKTSSSHAKPSVSHFRTLHRDLLETSLGELSQSGEPESTRIHNGRAQEDYDNRAYPKKWVRAAQQLAAANAANAIAKMPAANTSNWQYLGPSVVPADAFVAGESTGATAGTIYSGRTTAIAVSPNCSLSSCTVFIGAAGGGVWRTSNALVSTPSWSPANNGIPSNAIGSLVFDPNDTSGNTLYVGTGEPNGSSDSEAGVGLYKSTNGGRSSSLVAGSTANTAPCASNAASFTCPVATGRSIGAIAVDPANASHILIGTDVARHGSSSVNGGRFTPPGSAQVGLYESTDGGATFSPAVILTQDTVNPASPNGGDFFRGGCSDIELYRPGNETQVYAAFFDYGGLRQSVTLDGNSNFNQIFKSAGNGTQANSLASRTEFSLAPITTGPNPRPLRIYVGDAGSGPADFYTVANANVTAATLVGGNNGGWTKRSSSTNGTPGFASYNYCEGQCSYDMPVYSPPGSPDIVYIGGAMNYDEAFGTPPITKRSNGRAVQRSEDAGVNFTDMTIDTQGVSLHPDQHAIATTTFNPNIAFIANDGGIWRLNGSFSDVSSQCSSRGLTGADLTDCQHWLSNVPTTIATMNNGLGTLQYQSLSVNVQNPLNDIMGGTQDNGTHAFSSGSWFVSVFGDGGQSGIDPVVANNRFHTYFDAQIDVNFRGTSQTTFSEEGWDWISDTFFVGAGASEPRSFYIPIIHHPTVSGTLFTGLQHVWRTQDNGGNQAFLDAHCFEFPLLPGGFSGGDSLFTGAGGDCVALGKNLSTDNAFRKDKAPGQYIVATKRAPSDTGTLWVGLRRGRVFISSNADKPSGQVIFYRIDTSAQPERFVSGIAIDPSNPNHAFISYSGYNAYATASGTATGHVFEVTYDPTGHTATWTNIDHNIGDEPITDIALDSNGDLYVSTDFGVNMLPSGGSTWVPAAAGLPQVATYGLTINSSARILYAATHGRGAWRVQLP